MLSSHKYELCDAIEVDKAVQQIDRDRILSDDDEEEGAPANEPEDEQVDDEEVEPTNLNLTGSK